MRILWYSNAPWAASGYGNQTALWLPRLQSLGHEPAVAAFHGLHGAPMLWEGFTVYPGSPEDPWAQDFMLGHYQRHQADLMITLMDAWVLDPGSLREMQNMGVRIAHWQPVDCEPLGQLDRRCLSEAGTRTIAMSRFGEQQLADFGPLYVPHGVDSKLFSPQTELREKIRSKPGLEGKFVIGINAANQDPVRKGFGEQLAAFRLFHDAHPESRLLIHARQRTRSGSDLARIVEILQLKDAVEFGDPYLTSTGLTSSAELARWYSVLDVFSNCSYGEGFGIPVLEAQACGTPVVVTDCSALTELCGSGWRVDGDLYWNAGHSAWWTKPFIRAIYEAYEHAFEQAAGMREQAREFALRYDADTVLRQFWEPVLDELEGVTGTEKYAGLRWMPDSLPHDEAAEEAILSLVPEGGVFADTSAASGYYAVRAAKKASRVLAVSRDDRLAQNLMVNRLTNVVAQDKLDIAAEPFVDVLRLQAAEVMKLRDMIMLHQPALAICDGRGKSAMFAEWLTGHGYELKPVRGSRCVLAVRA